MQLNTYKTDTHTQTDTHIHTQYWGLIIKYVELINYLL